MKKIIKKVRTWFGYKDLNPNNISLRELIETSERCEARKH